MNTPKENKRAKAKRYYLKLRADPERYARDLERRRRNELNRKASKLEHDRKKWASLPQDDPKREQRRKTSLQARANLSDSVVAHSMGMSVKECPVELVKLKRAAMKLARALGTRIKTV
jgi:hypothetical protein